MIEMNDLVMVVRSCCSERVHPTIFEVVRFTPAEQSNCACCGREMPEEVFAGPNGPIGQPLSWLKKIPGLELLQDEKQKIEIPA